MAGGLTLAGAARAYADYQPTANDIVGVGGDTPQYILDFVSNGDYASDAGFNSAGNVNRLVTFDATPDSNGRAAYTNSADSAGGVSAALNPTVVLRAGEFPVTRISSSGNAITALLNDTASPENINFVASASEPTSAQQSQAEGETHPYCLETVQVATDNLELAVAQKTASDTAGTNAPSGISVADLVQIYDSSTPVTWNQVFGSADASTDTIVPLLPPTTSSVYSTFIKALTAANGNVAPTLSNPSIKDVEQNDPTAITGNATPNDVIEPFSAGRLALWNDNYFTVPGSAFTDSGRQVETAGVVLEAGTSPATTAGFGSEPAAASYDSSITDYVIFRSTDLNSTTPFEPGSTLNWVQTLFDDPANPSIPYVSSFGQADISAAGVTPAYSVLGCVN